MRYDIDTIVHVKYTGGSRECTECVQFRLTRVSKDSAYKTIDFETTTLTATKCLFCS